MEKQKTKLRDGSIMTWHRKIGEIEFAPNQTTRYRLDLQPNLVHRLALVLKINADFVSPANLTGNLAYLFKHVEIYSDKNELIKSCYGPSLAWLNQREFWTMPYHVHTTDTTINDRVTLIIPFTDHTIYNPMKTILNSNSYSKLWLRVMWGDWLDVYNGEATSYDVTCDIIALETLPYGDTIEEQLKIQNTPRPVLLDLSAEYEFGEGPIEVLLEENSFLKTVALTAESYINDSNWVWNTSIGRVRLVYDNESVILRDFGENYSIPSYNKSDYHIEGIDSTGTVATDDEAMEYQYVFEFARSGAAGMMSGDHSMAFRTINTMYPKLIIEPDALWTPTDPGRLQVFTRQIKYPVLPIGV